MNEYNILDFKTFQLLFVSISGPQVILKLKIFQ